MQYELTREGKGAGEVFNLSHLFMEIYKMGNKFSGGNTGESERYWETALRRLLNRIIQALKLAGETISIDNMRKLVATAPTEDEVRLISEMSDSDLTRWANKNYCVGCVMDGGENVKTKEEDEEHDLVYDYWMREFAKMPEKTRSTIEESFLGLAEPFMSGILKKYFSKGLNIRPEVTFEGKIIVLDFSVKQYLHAGIYAQGIFKLLWQQAIERRDINKYPMPAFLWCDESQYFVSEYDTIFQTTARSSRACTVFLTQNISNYYAQMGGDSSKAKVDSLLSNLSTKIFHCNADSVTNEWASKVIGYNLITLRSDSEQKKNFSFIADTVSKSYSAHLLPQVLPVEFTTLWTGGHYYGLKVQAIIQIKGRQWSDGANYRRVTFSQI